MTTIRRPTGDPRRRNQRGGSMRTCRNAFIVLIIFQVLSVLFSAFRDAPSAADDTTSKKQPHGLEFVLSEFELGKSRIISETEGLISKTEKRLGIVAPHQDIGEDVEEDDELDESSNTSPDGRHREDDGIDEEERDDKTDDEVEEEEATTSKGGITAGGYLNDYMYQRRHPSFRKEFEPQLERDKKQVAWLTQADDLKSCLYYSGESQGKIRPLFDSDCLDGELVAYNSQPFERTWCGKRIGPKSEERFSKPCKEPVHLFPVDNPPASADGMPPIVIRSSSDSKGVLEHVQCNIPCKQEKNMQGSQRSIEGTTWTITSTMDDPWSNGNAKIERTAYRKDQYYSTTSFKSSVPQSFFDFDLYDLGSSSAIDYDSAENAASYIVNENCRAQSSKRQKWLDGVKEHFTVASFGSCDHNTDTKLNIKDASDRIQLLKKYRFNLAFEAVAEKDYITERVWEALQAGTVPVVVGAPNILEHVPLNSVISSSNFQDFEDMGTYIKEVAENMTLWESFHAWRNNPDEIKAFEERYDFTRTSPSCRICRWAYAKKYGLGWNHTHQLVQKNVIPRKLCIDSDKKLASRPFRETWATSKNGEIHEKVKAEVSESCGDASSADASINVDGYTISRTIMGHDGVIDMALDALDTKTADANLVLRLETAVKNPGLAHFQNPHITMAAVHTPLVSSISLQDERSRITVLASWDTEFSNPEEGIVELVVQESGGDDIMLADEKRRIRVVLEDVNNLQDKTTEFFPSSFLNMMANDFVDPLLLFKIKTR